MKQGVDYIGVTCVFYCHDGKGKFLLHKRSNNCRDEKEVWDCGGGAMELGETFEKAVRREIKEEYCCNAEELQFAGVSNVLRKNGKEKTHWIALLFAARVDPKGVKIGDPEKMTDIGWFKANAFPYPQHSMLQKHFQQVQQFCSQNIMLQ